VIHSSRSFFLLENQAGMGMGIEKFDLSKNGSNDWIAAKLKFGWI
jgi:hypothetical protein